MVTELQIKVSKLWLSRTYAHPSSRYQNSRIPMIIKLV